MTTWTNAFVERFNGTMRRELLAVEEFDALLEARVVIAAWRDEYNTVRPHRGRAGKAPAKSAAETRKQAAGERARQTDGGRKERGQ